MLCHSDEHMVSSCPNDLCCVAISQSQTKIIQSIQGLECKAMQALLKHPAFVEALHTLLKPYSMAVPALVMPVQELARKLSAAAGQLCFVQRCYTRLSFSDSRAVRAQSQSLAQVGYPSAQDCWFQYTAFLGVPPDSLQLASRLMPDTRL